MSEFKFACPVCGQHITADSNASGGKINCPTCFRKIIVPQAPASTDSKLIISAAQADKPKPPQSGAMFSEPFQWRSPKGFPIAAIVLVLLLAVIGLAFVFREKLSKSQANASGGPHKPGVFKSPYAVPTNIQWSLELSKASLPEAQAVGRIRGSGFMCERATLQGGSLTLRQGKTWPPDLGISVNLFAQQGEELTGKTIEITPDRAPPLPKIVLRWKNDQEKALTENLTSGYAMRLVFGNPLEGHMPGRIYISLPDETKSFVAGTFDAEIRKPPQPKPKQPKAAPAPKPAKPAG
jgi:hypothetical protein